MTETWEYVENDDGSFGVHIDGAHDLYYDMEGACPTCFEIMRKITALPDLLAVCEALYHNEVGKGGDLDWHLCQEGYAEKLLAAISKAREKP